MLDWRAAAFVAAGGALGSVARYAIQSLFVARFGVGFPWATFGINVAGSFLIGLVAALGARDSGLVSPIVRAFLAVGILGGFTTFSAFSLETVALVRDGSRGVAFAYAVGSVLVGPAAAVLGLLAGRGGASL